MKGRRICDLLGIKYPIIQAPMIWITGANLAAAVSNAGGLGTIGLNAGAKNLTTDLDMIGERLRSQIRKAKGLTDKPFAINIAVPEQPFSDRYVEVAIEEEITAAIMVGDSPQSYTKRLQAAGIKVLYKPLTRVTVDAAKQAEQAGVDAVIMVGCEGGGHSGIDQLTTLVLIPQVAEAVKIPVIAGGGIADARGAAAAFALGADGVFIGTAFIATIECDAHPNVKRAIINATDTSTVAWIGDLGQVRLLKNNYAMRVLESKPNSASKDEIGKSSLNLDKHRPALIEGKVEDFYLSLGAGAGLVKEVVSAGELVRRIAAGIENE